MDLYRTFLNAATFISAVGTIVGLLGLVTRYITYGKANKTNQPYQDRSGRRLINFPGIFAACVFAYMLLISMIALAANVIPLEQMKQQSAVLVPAFGLSYLFVMILAYVFSVVKAVQYGRLIWLLALIFSCFGLFIITTVFFAIYCPSESVFASISTPSN